jgi:hypothetical protein
MPEQLIYDDREIAAISGHGFEFIVGQNHVTKIEAYGEAGQCGVVPWAAVYEGENIVFRTDLAGMTIEYKRPSKTNLIVWSNPNLGS